MIGAVTRATIKPHTTLRANGMIKLLLPRLNELNAIPVYASYDRIMKFVIEIIGWVGAALVLFAYGLLSAHKLDSRSAAYQWLNIGGSIGLVINTLWNGAIPSAAVNLVWMGIGAHALWRNSRAERETVR